MKVSAVIVSKFDNPLGDIIDSIRPIAEEIIVVKGACVWDRWAAAKRAMNPLVYTQDDDALVDVEEVVKVARDRWEQMEVVCNMPADRRREYQDGIALVGWGCCFNHSLVRSHVPGVPFSRYFQAGFKLDEVFQRECDRVFTGLSKLHLIDVPFVHLPQAHGTDRLGRDPRHGDYGREIRKRIAVVKEKF